MPLANVCTHLCGHAVKVDKLPGIESVFRADVTCGIILELADKLFSKAGPCWGSDVCFCQWSWLVLEPVNITELEAQQRCLRIVTPFRDDNFVDICTTFNYISS